MAKEKKDEPGSDLATVDNLLAAADAMQTPANAKALLQAFDGMMIEQVVPLREGGIMTGIYLGEGALLPMADPANPAIMRDVRTWRLRHPTNERVIARLIGSAKLDAWFPQVPIGSRVSIAHRGKTRSNAGRQVNDLIVAFLPPEPTNTIDVG